MTTSHAQPLAAEFAPYWQTARVAAEHGKRATVPVPPYPFHGAGSKQFSLVLMWSIILAVPALPVLALNVSLLWYAYPVSLLLLGLPAFAAFVYYSSRHMSAPSQPDIPLPSKPIDAYLEFRDPELKAKYANKPAGTAKIAMEELFEAYFDEKVDFKVDVLTALECRYDYAQFRFTTGQFKFFLTQWIPETLWHSKAQDEDQVREHYDRGNDFYAAFLGERMVYTSGLVSDPKKRESLEQLQDNKLEYVSERLQLKPGDRHLDIGCGWGTLAIHAAKFYGTTSTGVTLAANQIEFGRRRAAENGVEDRVNFLHMDYRDIPKQKFDKISCLEMAEHVGVRLFPSFMNQVYDMLEDDGLFFLQIAGLRRLWTTEDLIWGLFMAKYVFPGADASCPLAWVINQLEVGGFEVREVQTVGVHYSATIERWYRNWCANREKMAEAYGEKWARIWEVFLAWSTIIARQGSATCYQIVANKNVNKFDRVSVMRGIETAARGLKA
ncbi:S-adenosyl-L-methionine-dependent methyltransferase [Catenaria anguillulae PL171]|uniref:sphingolipid C(9)-methyltransferase n=1 Tax=Catenaria anguillulae PL171 TaxID=765915 RepID=A0A1Y2HVD1_9FUNG|nr:S-adenosyl-L-methionine-dependent methyltransferase [Catenaria anguillulae PL171]